MFKALSLVLMLGSLVASAALPPYAESTRRVNALLSDADVHAALGAAAWVESVVETEQGLYTVTSKKGCWVEAKVTSHSTGVQGPGELEVEVVRSGCQVR